MKINKLLFTSLFALYSLVAFSQDAPPPAELQVEMQRDVQIRDIPAQGLVGKKVYVVFEDSPKMTTYVRERLRSRGVTVAELADEADVRFQIMGTCRVYGKGRESKSGSMGKLLETSLPAEESLKVDYFAAQGPDLSQVAISTAVSRPLGITNLFDWATHKIGLAGRFNEMLTGDPRGFCFGPDCGKFVSFAAITVRGDNDLYWWLQASASNEKVVLDKVVSDIVESALKPFDDMGHAQPQQQAADKSLGNS